MSQCPPSVPPLTSGWELPVLVLGAGAPLPTCNQKTQPPSGSTLDPLYLSESSGFSQYPVTLAGASIRDFRVSNHQASHLFLFLLLTQAHPPGAEHQPDSSSSSSSTSTEVRGPPPPPASHMLMSPQDTSCSMTLSSLNKVPPLLLRAH